MEITVVRSPFKKFQGWGSRSQVGYFYQFFLSSLSKFSPFYCRLPLPSYFSYFSLYNKPPHNLVAFNNNDLLFLTILWVRTSSRVGWAVLLLYLSLVAGVGGSLIQPDSSVARRSKRVSFSYQVT